MAEKVNGAQRMKGGSTVGSRDRRKPASWWKIALLLMVWDAIAIPVAYFGALWVRFDCQFTQIPDNYLGAFQMSMPVVIITSTVVFWACRLYQRVWRYASIGDMIRVMAASFGMSLWHSVCITVFFGTMPLSYHVWGAIFQLILVGSIRFSVRMTYATLSRFDKMETQRVMIVGGGSAGMMLIRDLKRTRGTTRAERWPRRDSLCRQEVRGRRDLLRDTERLCGG